MGKISPGRRGLRNQKDAAKKSVKEQMIKEANARHDAEHGINATSQDFYAQYIQGTGLRQST